MTALTPWVFPGLATFILLIFAGALAASCFFFEDGTLRTQMFTGALSLATMAAGYFFGSSAGSAKKDDTIAAAVKPNGVPTP